MAKKTGKNTIEKEVPTMEEAVNTAAEEVKAEVIEKAEEVTEQPKEKTETKAAAGKRGRRPLNKNVEKPVKKSIEKKEEKQENVEHIYVQYAGREIETEDVMEKARQMYIAEGHRASSIKSLRIYIKPEEMKAYYVINDNCAGSIEL